MDSSNIKEGRLNLFLFERSINLTSPSTPRTTFVLIELNSHIQASYKKYHLQIMTVKLCQERQMHLMAL